MLLWADNEKESRQYLLVVLPAFRTLSSFNADCRALQDSGGAKVLLYHHSICLPLSLMQGAILSVADPPAPDTRLSTCPAAAVHNDTIYYFP